MIAVELLVLFLLCVVLTIAAYADRVYSEMGKFLAREYQDNLDAWTELVEPRFGLSRDSIALSASVLRQTSLAAIALVLGATHFGPATPATFSSVFTLLAELILIIVIFDRMLPQILFVRTKGVWAARVRYVIQMLFYMVLPITLLLGLLLSIASLAESEDDEEEEHPDEGVDALLEAGEEEGILEESDRALVRSVVEFGDMVAREVMTPRPEMFTVADSTTLEDFIRQIGESAFSRVPVYAGTVDNITGIAFAHDLLQITDADAASRTVRDIQRPAVFVPEPKKVNELLREMQSEKQHMRIVVDEYGAVAGLVTIEDLIEAIVGNIEDEHEASADDIVREDEDTVVVPGGLDIGELRALLTPDQGSDAETRPPVRLPQHLEASTVAGLVTELAGHIPLAGEVIESEGLRLEVVTGTSRRVTSVRVRVVPIADDTDEE